MLSTENTLPIREFDWTNVLVCCTIRSVIAVVTSEGCTIIDSLFVHTIVAYNILNSVSQKLVNLGAPSCACKSHLRLAGI